MATKKEILNVRGITEARYLALHKAAGGVTENGTGRFQTGSDVKADHQNRFKVTTGSSEFDAILGGGVESKCLTEVYGEYRTGKSQLCMTLAVTGQMGPHAGKVIYVDTEGK